MPDHSPYIRTLETKIIDDIFEVDEHVVLGEDEELCVSVLLLNASHARIPRQLGGVAVHKRDRELAERLWRCCVILMQDIESRMTGVRRPCCPQMGVKIRVLTARRTRNDAEHEGGCSTRMFGGSCVCHVRHVDDMRQAGLICTKRAHYEAAS